MHKSNNINNNNNSIHTLNGRQVVKTSKLNLKIEYLCYCFTSCVTTEGADWSARRSRSP